MFSVVNMGDFEQPKPLNSPDETEHSSPCFLQEHLRVSQSFVRL